MKTWAANETSIHIHLVVSIFFASLEFATRWHRCEAGHANWVIALRKVLASACKVVDGIATTRQFRGAGLGTEQSGGCGGDAATASSAPRGVTPKLPGRFLLRMATLVCTQPELFSMKAQERLTPVNALTALQSYFPPVARRSFASLTSQKTSAKSNR